MMFPGAGNSAELQKAAAEKVKIDFGNFVIGGLFIEAVAYVSSSFFGVDWILI